MESPRTGLWIEHVGTEVLFCQFAVDSGDSAVFLQQTPRDLPGIGQLSDDACVVGLPQPHQPIETIGREIAVL
jgi:hypothetical protein